MNFKEHEEIIAKLKFLAKEKNKDSKEFNDITTYEFIDLYIKEETLRKIDSPYEEIEILN